MLKRLIQSLTIAALVITGAIALSTSAQTSATGGQSGARPSSSSSSTEMGTGGAADAGGMMRERKRTHMDGGMGDRMHMDGGMRHRGGHMDGGMHKGM